MARRAEHNGGPTRYAIYLRCSTDDQKHGDFTTIDAQREHNTRHVAQIGGTLVREYADEGRSGTNLKRTGWQALLRDAEEGLFDAVVVTYMSRLARGEAYHVAEYLLKERGVLIELVRERFTPDLAGHVNKQMTILMDGMYPKMVSQWTKTKMQQMVEKGYVCGQTPTLGYRKVPVTDAPDFSGNGKEPPKRLVIHDEEAEIVHKAFTILAETAKYNPVVDYLRVATGRKWTIDSATRLLRNDAFRGVLRFGEWVNETAHEPIVSEDLWNAARG
jgi:DNA invertase Pin-like site-specific DNA recombinase